MLIAATASLKGAGEAIRGLRVTLETVGHLDDGSDVAEGSPVTVLSADPYGEVNGKWLDLEFSIRVDDGRTGWARLISLDTETGELHRSYR